MLRKVSSIAALLIFAAGILLAEEDQKADSPPRAGEGKKIPELKQWRGLHLLNYNSDKDLETLANQVPKLAEMGLNVLILEVNYHFRFQSYPKLRQGREPITPEGAAKLMAVCRKNG